MCFVPFLCTPVYFSPFFVGFDCKDHVTGNTGHFSLVSSPYLQFMILVIPSVEIEELEKRTRNKVQVLTKSWVHGGR